MTSEAKITANRQNAQKSTGPRTALGKARSRSNAFRHGLSIPIGSEPTCSEDLTSLTSAFLPDEPNESDLQAAIAVAQAQLEIARVRQARIELLKKSARAAAGLSTCEETRLFAYGREIALLFSFERYEDRALSQRRRALRKLIER